MPGLCKIQLEITTAPLIKTPANLGVNVWITINGLWTTYVYLPHRWQNFMLCHSKVFTAYVLLPSRLGLAMTTTTPFLCIANFLENLNKKQETVQLFSTISYGPLTNISSSGKITENKPLVGKFVPSKLTIKEHSLVPKLSWLDGSPAALRWLFAPQTPAQHPLWFLISEVRSHVQYMCKETNTRLSCLRVRYRAICRVFACAIGHRQLGLFYPQLIHAAKGSCTY